MNRAAGRLVLGWSAVAVLAGAAALAGVGVRATVGGHVSVDEPQYLLTALSLWEDHDLDIADELAQQRWREFSDVPLPVQTSVRPDGRALSPHDVLLPLLLAAPTGLGGWVAAKAALALAAAVAAALTCWVAVRRFAVPLPVAAPGSALAFGTAPLAVYGQQVYPEIVGALAVLAGVAALTGRLGRSGQVVLVGAVVALPWLAVKYAPVAAALAGLGALRLLRAGRRRAAAGLSVALLAAGAAYLLVHRLVWGGWTVYAGGDHFERTGEFSVVGVSPDYVGRSLRLVALLVDRGFGLVGWQPAWLLLVPAAAALLRKRGWVLLAPLAAGWATATWLALTMHGYWWPGRQLVVVLPLGVLVVLTWLAGPRPERSGPGPRRWRAVALGAGGVLAAAGVATYAAVLAAGYRRTITWVVDFERVAAPAYRLLRPLLPDYRGESYLAGHLLWAVALAALALLGWRQAGPPGTSEPRPLRAVRTDPKGRFP